VKDKIEFLRPEILIFFVEHFYLKSFCTLMLEETFLNPELKTHFKSLILKEDIALRILSFKLKEFHYFTVIFSSVF